MRIFIIILFLTCQFLATAQTLTTTSISGGGGDGDNCVVTDTRTNLINLRNTNGLIVGCHYVLTDHVQGRLVAGTTITLHADSPNEFSENVSVNTTYDNEGWRGIYDIDRALVLELTDNRNNICRGINGTEVTNFDWGNINYTNCLVDNATWNTTIGQTRTCTNVKVTGSSILTNLTQTGGTLLNIDLKGQSQLILTSANISLRSFELDNQSTFQATNYTAGNLLSFYKLNASSINISSSSSALSVTGVELKNSTITHSTVTTGTITGTNLYMFGGSSINHTNGALNLSLNRVTIDGASSINHSSKSILISSYQILGGSSINSNTSTGAGNISLSGGYMNGQSTITNSSDMNLNGTRFEMDRSSSVNLQNGALGTLTLTNSKLDNTGQVNILATATAGNSSITNCNINDNSFFQKQGTSTNTFSYLNLLNQSRIVSNNIGNTSISRLTASELVQINNTSAVAGTFNIIDCNFRARSVYNHSADGSNNMLYVDGHGISTNIIFSGTSASQTLQQADINNSSVTFSNNTTANTFTQITLENSTFIAQGLTLNKGTTYVNATNGSTININAPTGVGSISYLKADNVSTITIQGTAGASTRLTALQQGGINHNGGNATNITKMMPNTLTTGAFNHSNLIMISPTSRILTGVNTNRSEYIGVVSTTPLF